MAEKKLERTHKHQNIIDDVLDFGLAVAGTVWYFFFSDVQIDAKTMAMVATTGAGARASLRRILMKLWGPQINAIESRVTGDGVPEVAPEENTNPDPDPAA